MRFVRTKHPTKLLLSLVFVLGVAWTAGADAGSGPSEEDNEGGDRPKVGIGVSFSPFNTIVQEIEIPPLQLADFRVPILIGSRFKLEPEFGILRLTERAQTNSSTVEFFDFPREIEDKFTQLRFALGGYYRHPATEKLEVYVGPRVGIIRSSESRIEDGEKESETLSHLSWGAAVGGEYFFSSHFSLGGEVQFNYLNLDEPENPFLTDHESTLLNTNASVLLRFYF